MPTTIIDALSVHIYTQIINKPERKYMMNVEGKEFDEKKLFRVLGTTFTGLPRIKTYSLTHPQNSLGGSLQAVPAHKKQ